MNDFNIFFKKIIDWIEHFVNILASILGVLNFFGVDYKKIKSFIQFVVIKMFIHKIKKNITYIDKKVSRILYNRFSNVKRWKSNLIDNSRISSFPIIACCLFLSTILFFDSFDHIRKVFYTKVITENSDFNQYIYNGNIRYATSGNDNKYLNENIISEDNIEIEKLYNPIFYINIDENFLDEIIIKEIGKLMNSCKENTPLNNEASSDAYFYSEIEADLFNLYNKNNEPLSLDLLDEIIKGREELFELYPNKTIAWLLANSYQRYAYFNLKETNETDNILFYYMQSVYYAKKSLEFEMDSEDKEMLIHYIRSRYKDIADCTLLDEETRVRAYEVYYAMLYFEDDKTTSAIETE